MARVSNEKGRNDHVVVALFSSRAAAREAIDAIERLSRDNQAIHLDTARTKARNGGEARNFVLRNYRTGLRTSAVLGLAAAALIGGRLIARNPKDEAQDSSDDISSETSAAVALLDLSGQVDQLSSESGGDQAYITIGADEGSAAIAEAQKDVSNGIAQTDALLTEG